MCSGIEAASVAWHHLGWQPTGFSEIEPFPSAVLAHHYPNVPNYGDMTKHEQWPLGPGSVDILVGGTPCQSFSVAGLRKGLSDPRGGLMLTYLEIARRLRPRWVVWENVPGVLSSGRGRDFGAFLGALSELRYGWAYRVLDAQYCRVDGRWPKAVPQRRRRVFVVGCIGDGAAAAEVLALGQGLRWHFEESRASRKVAPADAEGCAGSGRVTSHDVAPCLETTRHDYSRADGFTMVGQPTWPADVAPTLAQSRSGSGSPGYSNQELFSQGAGNLIPQPVPYDLFQITAPVNRQNRQPGDPCHTLARDNAAHAAVVAHAFYSNNGTHGVNQQPEVSPAVKVGSGLGIPSPPAVAQSMTVMSFHPLQDPIPNTDGSTHCMGTGGSQGHASIAVAQAMTVRRLTPRECERLQGFPDDWTMIPWRKKAAADCPDGPRYRALGNSMAVNVVTWIGERIQAVDAQTRFQSAPPMDNGGDRNAASPL